VVEVDHEQRRTFVVPLLAVDLLLNALDHPAREAAIARLDNRFLVGIDEVKLHGCRAEIENENEQATFDDQ